MTNEMWCAVSVADFASYIGLRSHFNRTKKLQDERTLSKSEMSFMYVPGTTPKHPSTVGFTPELTTFHRILRKSLAPREGDVSGCPTYRDMEHSNQPSPIMWLCTPDHVHD
jgi:hypothetical protein